MRSFNGGACGGDIPPQGARSSKRGSREGEGGGAEIGIGGHGPRKSRDVGVKVEVRGRSRALRAVGGAVGPIRFCGGVSRRECCLVLGWYQETGERPSVV